MKCNECHGFGYYPYNGYHMMMMMDREDTRCTSCDGLGAKVEKLPYLGQEPQKDRWLPDHEIYEYENDIHLWAYGSKDYVDEWTEEERRSIGLPVRRYSARCWRG